MRGFVILRAHIYLGNQKPTGSNLLWDQKAGSFQNRGSSPYSEGAQFHWADIGKARTREFTCSVTSGSSCSYGCSCRAPSRSLEMNLRIVPWNIPRPLPLKPLTAHCSWLFSRLQVGPARFAEPLVPYHNIIRCHNPEDLDWNLHGRENLKFRTFPSNSDTV
jgi:hypothetical protein